MYTSERLQFIPFWYVFFTDNSTESILFTQSSESMEHESDVWCYFNRFELCVPTKIKSSNFISNHRITS